MSREDADLVDCPTAARLLGISIHTLRRLETPDGRWCHLSAGTLRVFRVSPKGQRRYSRLEIRRLLNRSVNG